MTIRVALQHNTHYTFDRPVALSKHIIRLRPAPHCRTPIHAYSLKITPANHFINWQQDAYGNFLASIVFPEKTTRLSVEVEVLADMVVINPFDFFLDSYAETTPFDYPPALKNDLLPYLEKQDCGSAFEAFLRRIPTESLRTNDFLVALNQRVQEHIGYCIRLEPGVQTPEETLSLRKGSCRDSAWLLVQLLRHLGFAARFASGYLVQLAPDEKPLDGPAGPSADFTDLHAWCEVFLPGAGWVGLDPTSGLFAGEGHIPLACTPSPQSAAPIEGFTDECDVTFAYSNTVSRFHEDPRVTKPYSDAEWADILMLGESVDCRLKDQDVRLTQGGEPTFVSIDDMEAPEWNTEALGSHKLRLSKDLLLRLRDHFAPHGLLHYGQGKWYPGEPVPRWALGLFWRRDNAPLWHKPALLARVDKDYGHSLADAKRFGQQLATELALDAHFVQAVYEDGLHYLLQEQSLPKNLDALIADAKSPLERQRLARVLNQGFDTPTGFVIPLERDLTGTAWCSTYWHTRRGRLVLIPGDSPMGLRLPLESLPYHEEDEPFFIPEQDPFAPQAPLPVKNQAVQDKQTAPAETLAPSQRLQQQVHRQNLGAGESLASPQEAGPIIAPERRLVRRNHSGQRVIRTALCIEVRAGKIHIFLPPVPRTEDFVALLQAIETTADTLSLPVVIEGYEPPADSRLCCLKVTPDPGVVEVNIHPSNSWRELVANTTALYKLARESRLGAEKFMQDGRHTGTGGGNHMTLGAATPADSPFLRRPDLLQSVITLWQHHPSLSYLFSGTFIGPTSQAPRVDEGRDEMLYELEIAFAATPQGQVPSPWLVDRLYRNLLIDITGNTHRAEFCIDKLYAAGSASGRQGLLELRGFEMPPHPQMSLVQALLVRSLLARAWQSPYRHPLVRFGTDLHDRFMLPHFIWRDIEDVVADLNNHGIAFRSDWLKPFWEFRFPHYGEVQIDDIWLELRAAIEPWHVLGEEATGQGTARYVDSSVERLQVKLTGLTAGRYLLACNGRRVPLNATGRSGEYVAGIRYRAWSPPSALHPTLGVHSPLTFDLIDTWSGRSVGGCRYHVSHPGGRSYNTFPVNAFEAESRRFSRFDTTGHTQGPYTQRPVSQALREFIANPLPPRPMAPPPEESPNDYPHTLDLRYPGPAA